MKGIVETMDTFKEKWSKIVHRKNGLFLLGIAGILLIGFSGFFSTDSNTEPAADSSYQAESDYQKKIEEQLTEVIGQVQGAGEVTVMLTLESGPETVYAQNEQSQTSTREDEEGTVQRDSSFQNEHILFDSGVGKQALVEEQLVPDIKGVAVVCSGGDDIAVIERITELVSVVLDLPSSRICVTKKI